MNASKMHSPSCGERGIDKSIPSLPRASLQKKADKILQINLRILSAFFSGERGIRTPGTSQYNGFQDRRNRPLCHLSKTSLEVLFFKSDAKVRLFFEFASVWDIFFHLNVFFILNQLLTLFNVCFILHIYKIAIFEVNLEDTCTRCEK